MKKTNSTTNATTATQAQAQATPAISSAYLNSHKVTLAPFGEACFKLSEGTTAETVKALASTYAEAYEDSKAIFNFTNRVLALRQTHGSPEDISAALDLLKRNAQRLYGRTGSHINSRGKEIPALIFHDERNAQHAADTADFGVYAMIMQELKDCPLKEAELKFFGSLTEYLGAVLRGDGRRFIDVKSAMAKELDARKAENKKKAEKAAETRERNKAAKAEAEAVEKEKSEKMTALEEEVARLKSEGIDLKKANKAIFEAFIKSGMAEKDAQRYAMIAATAVMNS